MRSGFYHCMLLKNIFKITLKITIKIPINIFYTFIIKIVYYYNEVEYIFCKYNFDSYLWNLNFNKFIIKYLITIIFFIHFYKIIIIDDFNDKCVKYIYRYFNGDFKNIFIITYNSKIRFS